MTNPFRNIGHRIRQLREREGWTQTYLVEQVNRTRYAPDVKQPHIANIEGRLGEKLPSLTLLAALAEVFQVSIDEVLGLAPLSDKPTQLDGLRAEDKAIIQVLITRLREDADKMEEDWAMLTDASESLAKLGDPVRPL